MQPDTNMSPPRRPAIRPMPVFGCLALLVVAAVAGALAVGGSFWAWMTVAGLILVAGIALVIFLIRQNTRTPPPEL